MPRAQRPSRAASQRGTASRAATMRPEPQVAYKGILYVDPKSIPRNVVYRWIRESMLGQYDGAHLRQQASKGWRAVPAARHPEFAAVEITGKPITDGMIRAGASILCERNRRDQDADNDELARENMETIRGIKWATEGLDDAPKLIERDELNIQQVTTRAQPNAARGSAPPTAEDFKD